jgi:hypothetical protein
MIDKFKLSEKIDNEIWNKEHESARFHSEIGYFMGRSNALSLIYLTDVEINYQALTYAHLNWRMLRKLDKTGETY